MMLGHKTSVIFLIKLSIFIVLLVCFSVFFAQNVEAQVTEDPLAIDEIEQSSDTEEYLSISEEEPTESLSLQLSDEPIEEQEGEVEAETEEVIENENEEEIPEEETTLINIPDEIIANLSTSDLNENGIQDHLENQVIVTGMHTLIAGEYYFNNLILDNYTILKLKSNRNLASFKGVKINANNLTVESNATIESNSEGYGNEGPGFTETTDQNLKAASYGGVGGLNTPESIYGSAREPLELGTGLNDSRRGGGAMYLVIFDTFRMDGYVSANGAQNSSGGSIYVRTQKFEGAGLFRANGGGANWPNYNSAGGGGRIAIYYDQSTFDGKVKADGGMYCNSGCNIVGGNGTVGLFDVTNNDLLSGGDFRFQENDAPFNFNNLKFKDGGTIEIEKGLAVNAKNILLESGAQIVAGDATFLNSDILTIKGGKEIIFNTSVFPIKTWRYSTLKLVGAPNINIPSIFLDDGQLVLSGKEILNVDSLDVQNKGTVTAVAMQTLFLDVPNIIVGQGAFISANMLGYCTWSGPGASVGNTFGGASYGGKGQNNEGGVIYGSATEPNDFGSGGNASTGPTSCGGGVIRIITTNLLNDGTISSNGGFGSSGGSVYITTQNLSGSGTFVAKGGVNYCVGAGCFGVGGGGRIAIYYENSSFTGTTNVDSGLYCFGGCFLGGTAGTIVMEEIEFEIPEEEEEEPSCEPDCFSNVMFLPGMMASRLYDDEDELWFSPAYFFFDKKQEKLALDDEGKSVNDVRTKENLGGILDKALTVDVYKSFIEDLDKWKNDEKIINDYALVPYDWRLSLEDILNNGRVEDGQLSYSDDTAGDKYIIKKLEELVTSSKSGKVTIVAHSNGGLVAKYLIHKLQVENPELANKIDKLILVASPQVGTPEAIATILHGVSVMSGLVIDKDTSRYLAEDFPVMYNLLPSEGYFNIVDTNKNPLVNFNDSYKEQIEQYGKTIDTKSELKNYILGSDGREKPEKDKVKEPNIGNSYLYDKSDVAHDVIDNWEPSSDLKIIQIAGWGAETLSSIEYKKYYKWKCEDGLCGLFSDWSYKLKTVVDGDHTVVVPSALWMQYNTTEQWLVNLIQYSNLNNTRKEHKDILEIPNLLDLIKSKIKGEINFDDSQSVVIHNNINLIADAPRLHFHLHSPLTLGIFDSVGRYTGLDPVTFDLVEEIPDVYYLQVGEVQYISVPYGLEYTLVLYGVEDGSFALDIDKQIGNEIVASTSFQGIPSYESTKVEMNIDELFEVGASEITIDSNGDGTVDYILSATPEGVTVYEETEEVPVDTEDSPPSDESTAGQAGDATEETNTSVVSGGAPGVVNIFSQTNNPPNTNTPIVLVQAPTEEAPSFDSNVEQNIQIQNQELEEDRLGTVQGENIENEDLLAEEIGEENINLTASAGDTGIDFGTDTLLIISSIFLLIGLGFKFIKL